MSLQDQSGFEQYEKTLRASGGMTELELHEKYGQFGICEACESFDMESCYCTQDIKTKRILLIDGPNEEAHIPKKKWPCPKYVEAERESDNSAMNSYWAKGVSYI
jgi:hypothetical protein